MSKSESDTVAKLTNELQMRESQLRRLLAIDEQLNEQVNKKHDASKDALEYAQRTAAVNDAFRIEVKVKPRSLGTVGYWNARKRKWVLPSTDSLPLPKLPQKFTAGYWNSIKKKWEGGI